MLNDFDYGIYLNKDIDNGVISTNISTFDDFDLFINKDEYRLLCSLADKRNKIKSFSENKYKEEKRKRYNYLRDIEKECEIFFDKNLFFKNFYSFDQYHFLLEDLKNINDVENINILNKEYKEFVILNTKHNRALRMSKTIKNI